MATQTICNSCGKFCYGTNCKSCFTKYKTRKPRGPNKPKTEEIIIEPRIKIPKDDNKFDALCEKLGRGI